MSLLQDVLRSQNTDTLDKRLASVSISGANRDRDDDDELINVVSAPGTPARSLPPSRPQSPTPRATATATVRPARALHLASTNNRPPRKTSSSSDPLKAFPTDISQKIFTQLTIADLANCAGVSQKWCRSQTLNYVWFQHYRKENFHDDSLPPGKWTKRESKQNWRTTYIQSIPTRDGPPAGPLNPSSRNGSGYSSPRSGLGSGYQTPSISVKEANEEKWRAEAESLAKPGKGEMRDMYKEMGGRKSKGKTKLGGGSVGIRDRGVMWGEEM